MKKFYSSLLLFIALFSNNSYADNFNFQLIPYNFKTLYMENNEGTFPLIKSSNEKAAEKINTFLHVSILNRLPPKTIPQKAIVLNKTDFAQIDLVEIKETNQNRTVQIKLALEGCGAYCESYHKTFVFDTRDGRLLTQGEMINPSYLTHIGRIVNRANTKKIQTFIDKAKRDLEKPNKGNTDKVEIKEQILMYESCLKVYTDKNFNLKSLGEVTFGDGNITFSYGECSNHALRALDELGELNHQILVKVIKPYLSDYGKYIYFGEGKGETPKINPFSQIYMGKINKKTDVVLYVGNINRNIAQIDDIDYAQLNDEKYFYTKEGKAIFLFPHEESSKEKYILVEKDFKKNKELSRFTFKIINNKLIGEWRNAYKTLPFEAEPM